ncbi:MAG: hypothetical protein CXT73_07590 [Methanobacteriota archaeon]|nr:MAG: hypothetical protein CXT73_07590 [Euryarchaeota archaeon]
MENLQFDTKDTVEIDSIKLHKMVFIYNALENGWTINKKKDIYIFNKKHEGKKEVLLDDYLRRFMVKNFDINNI